MVGPLGFAPDFERSAPAAIVSLADLGKEDAAGLLNELNFPRLIVVPDFAGVASLWVLARNLGGCLGLEIKKNLLIRRNRALKRADGPGHCASLFVCSLPLMLGFALWIKLASRGPVFYRQMREGLDGRHIPVWKLRTMHVDGDRLLEQWFENHPEDLPDGGAISSFAATHAYCQSSVSSCAAPALMSCRSSGASSQAR